MALNLHVVGLSHQTAPVAVRERLATTPARITELRTQPGIREAVALATCNRVEIYCLAETSQPTRQFLHDETHLYEKTGRDCVRHLWEVVCGLDSMVLGETEILGQVKDAYAAAHDGGHTGPTLNRLFQKAFAGAKQIRTETGITRGSTSVGNVAVDLAQKIFRDLAPRTVMVVGTGEMSEATAKALRSRGAGTILVCSRTHERAQALAGQLAGKAISDDDWPAMFPCVDIVISATAAPHPIITREKLIPLMRVRENRPLFLIDIAVPRDVERACGDLDDVYVYDIDDLQQIAATNRATREREAAACRVIIDSHVERYMEWFTARTAGNGSLPVNPNRSIAITP